MNYRNKYTHRLYKKLRLALIPLVPLYFFIYRLKQIFSKNYKVEIPVICVGNISTGGTGKTPTVISIADFFKDIGYRPGIISRGYLGTKSKEGAIVTDGESVFLKSDESGDEPYLMATTLKDVPIAVCGNRLKAISLLRNRFNIDVIIMDDGFQNFSIHKDISIVIIDAMNPFGNNLLIPAGDLREPESSLKRGDIVIINKSDLIDNGMLLSLRERIKRYLPNDYIMSSCYNINSLHRFNDVDEIVPAEYIKNKKILIITAIGNPLAFFIMVKKLNPAKTDIISFPDHYKYKDRDIQEFIRKSRFYDYVITTEKDYVKLEEYNLNNNFYFMRISLDIFEKKSFHDKLYDLVKKSSGAI